MILYPAIDIFEGKAVRLEKGSYSRMTVYDRDPASRAERIRDDGATHLHVVDLEGARSGSQPNLHLVEEIVRRTGLFTELGGGIRDMAAVRRCLDAGVSRVILGTAAAENGDFLREAAETYGERIAVGADLLDGRVAVRGWEQTSAWTAEDFFRHLTEIGVKTVICTDISRDGMLAGSNHGLYEKLSSAFPLDLIASGGVSGAEDLRALRKLGMAGAILGKAYYSGAVSIPEALAACADPDGLPPGICADSDSVRQTADCVAG